MDGSLTPVLMAVNTKTLSPQMMGVEVPCPSMATFHLMFSSSPHVTGGFAVVDTPVAFGPRHWCQLSVNDSPKAGIGMAISNRHALRMDLLFMLFLLITEVEFWI